jgi:hypothetical protein
MFQTLRLLFAGRETPKERSAVRIVRSVILTPDIQDACLDERVRVEVNDNTTQFFAGKGLQLQYPYFQHMAKTGWTVNRVYVKTDGSANNAQPWPPLAEAAQHPYHGVPGVLWSPRPQFDESASSVPNHRNPLYAELHPSGGASVFALKERNIPGQTVSIFPHEVWPADRIVFDVPRDQMDTILRYNYGVAINGWYEDPAWMPDLLVHTHGSVILRAVDGGAPGAYNAFDLHFKPVPAEEGNGPDVRMPVLNKIVNRARYYPDPSVFVGATLDAAKRYILLVGGSIERNAGKRHGEYWAAIGETLASRWNEFKAAGFAGILTRSSSGACDTVSFEEEVCRGFCSKHQGPDKPVHHLTDDHLVYTRGDAATITYGTTNIFAAQNDDWRGTKRDRAMALLASGGLVIMAGLSKAEIAESTYAFSFLVPGEYPTTIVVANGGADSVEVGFNMAELARQSGGEVHVEPWLKPVNQTANALTSYLSNWRMNKAAYDQKIRAIGNTNATFAEARARRVSTARPRNDTPVPVALAPRPQQTQQTQQQQLQQQEQQQPVGAAAVGAAAVGAAAVGAAAVGAAALPAAEPATSPATEPATRTSTEPATRTSTEPATRTSTEPATRTSTETPYDNDEIDTGLTDEIDLFEEQEFMPEEEPRKSQAGGAITGDDVAFRMPLVFDGFGLTRSSFDRRTSVTADQSVSPNMAARNLLALVLPAEKR